MEEGRNIAARIGERVSEFGDSIKQGVRPVAGAVNDSIEGLNDRVSDMTSSVKDRVGSVMSDFSAKGAVNSSSEFLNSNSIVAKFAFIILVLILFVFLFNLGVKLITYFTSPPKSPYIVQGLISGTNGMVISQDPNSSSSVTILRSNNEMSGIEFTWSVWLYVSSVSDGKKFLHVFNKGDSNWNTDGVASVNNGPGLYLINTSASPDAVSRKNEMGLRILMDTENTENSGTKSTQIIDITEIPLQKWFNVCIRLENVIMDVYMNGTNSGRIIMPYVPRQNYNDINVCQNGGFNGNLSDLRYYSHALSVYEINSLIWKGPNFTQNSSSALSTGTTYSNGINYMSNMWYTNKW